MFRQAFIQEGIVRFDKRTHAAILAQHAVKEQFRFLAKSLPQVVVKIPKQIAARIDRFHIAQPQPLPREIGRQVHRTSVRQHPSRLLLQLARLAQLAPNRHLQQFIIGDTTPQEERQARRQFQIADPINPTRRNFLWVALHPEQKLRVGEYRSQRHRNAGVEIAVRTTSLVEGQRRFHFLLRHRSSIGTAHQC